MSKKKGIIGSTLQLTVAVLFIKVLGLAKKSIIAAVCGATAETDAFFDRIRSDCRVMYCLLFVYFNFTALNAYQSVTKRRA